MFVTYFAADAEASLAGATNEIDAACGGYLEDVEATARELRQGDVAMTMISSAAGTPMIIPNRTSADLMMSGPRYTVNQMRNVVNRGSLAGQNGFWPPLAERVPQ
jgi:hypothetical protein